MMDLEIEESLKRCTRDNSMGGVNNVCDKKIMALSQKGNVQEVVSYGSIGDF